MKIFLSYPSDQFSVAEDIYYSLISERHSVFFDKTKLPAGMGYNKRIRDAIKDSDLFIFIITNRSVSEGTYTISELLLAEEMWQTPEGKVLPVMIEDVEINKIPPYLKAVHILKPKGSISAEVLATVDKLCQQHKKPRKFIIWLAAFFLLLTSIAALIFNAYSPKYDLLLLEQVITEVPFYEDNEANLSLKFQMTNSSKNTLFLTEVAFVNNADNRIKIPIQNLELEYFGQSVTPVQITTPINKLKENVQWKLCLEFIDKNICSGWFKLNTENKDENSQSWSTIKQKGRLIGAINELALISERNLLLLVNPASYDEIWCLTKR